ncbi:Aste57867_25498 [Aphanomyces stellatus]|uniref:Aste57867_25498 protein n=1 Tax=Aphanomyces stellatus TaxID=120398 RepID=A0A485LUM6_9STRA|nr:hypothetical protein As57867_025419 [Aphanomyces stellatus]VFU02121.1 Aste57867_25498 [Aphanomyces stellatus]
MDTDEKTWECVDLIKLDLSHNEIPSIPIEVGLLGGLLFFKMCQNVLPNIPQELFTLTSLAYLDLSNNLLSGDFSSSIGQLKQLKELDLRGNKLNTLPESLGGLTFLEILRIEDNQFEFLPRSIGELEKLITLTVQSNQLQSLPENFCNLRAIATLDLSKNNLASLQGCLKHNISLKHLDLRQNRLTVFPELPLNCCLDTLLLGFNELTYVNVDSLTRAHNHLTVLDLRENKLSELPDKVCLMQKLKTLDLTNNDLSDLPPGLGYLPQLNHILTHGNSLRSIRRSILSAGCEPLKKYLRTRGGPVGVETAETDEFNPSAREMETKSIFRDSASTGILDLSGKILSSIPSELWGISTLLMNLTIVNLSKTGLKSLPDEISRFCNLKTLIIEENMLESIPVSVNTLQQLQILRVRKNNMTNAGIDLLFVKNSPLSCSLKEVDIRNNFLMSVPCGMENMSSLNTLLLSYNRISELDDVNWSLLKNLSIVSIADNKLISVGKIYEAPNLTSLSIENNSLTQIPFELGFCTKLKALNINGNPQRSVRLTTINKGTEEILLYLKNKAPPSEIETETFGNVQHPSPNVSEQSLPGTKFLAQAANAPPVPTINYAQPTMSSAHMVNNDLESTIALLENELEGTGLSAAKRYALKKDLAKARAKKIRESRQA